MRRVQPKGLVYIIAPANEWPCKIGYAADVENRLSSLQTGNHVELMLWSCWVSDSLTAHAIERLIHSKLGRKRIRGEWYAVSVSEAEETVAGLDGVVRQANSLMSKDELEYVMRCHPRR